MSHTAEVILLSIFSYSFFAGVSLVLRRDLLFAVGLVLGGGGGVGSWGGVLFFGCLFCLVFLLCGGGWLWRGGGFFFFFLGRFVGGFFVLGFLSGLFFPFGVFFLAPVVCCACGPIMYERP